MFPLSRRAAWPFMPPGIAAVAVQVVVLLNSSAEDNVSLPVDDPPATSTWPWSTIVFGSSVIVAPTRGEVVVPAEDQLPFETLGSKTIADDCTVEPFRPPAIRILPLLF